VRLDDRHLVCGDAGRTFTIVDVATRQTRAKDSDRTGTCQVLDSVLAEGQLSLEEHRHRVDAAIKATTLSDLQPLVDDLQLANPERPLVTRQRLRGATALS
jgi:hypothetical protein